MPRVTLASVSQIDSFLEKIRLLQTEGYISEVNITTAEQILRDFSAFSDKAFKAFYARKILQIPPVIAAQVFDVSNGLISQAAGDRNVYTVRNGERMEDDLARGFFMLPNVPGRFGNALSRQARTNIFRNLAKLAVIKNRGVDVPRFQNRMVAGYMSEMAADELRDNILPRFARNIREQMGSAQASATPEATQPTAPQPRRAGIVQMSTETTIQELIYRGTDRDTATAFIEKFNNLGLFVYVVDYATEVEGLTEVQLRLPSGDSPMTNMPSEQEVRTAFSETRIGTLSSLSRMDDRNYLLKFQIGGVRVQSEESSTSEVDPSRFSNQMTSLGYSDEFIAQILEELNNRRLRITDISLIDETVFGPTETNSFVLSVRAGAPIGILAVAQIQRFFTQLYERNNYVRSAYVTRDDDGALEIRFYHTEVHEDDADENATENVSRATGSSSAIELGNRYRSDYEGLAPYLQNTMPLGAYARCRAFGWLHSNIADWCREFHRRNLKVVGASTYTGGLRATGVRYMGLSVIRTNNEARGIRPDTWLTIVRNSLIRAQGPAEVRVMLAGSSYIQPARFRRNPTRGNLYLPLIGIAEPREYDLSESQHGETQPATEPAAEGTTGLNTIPGAFQRALRENGWTSSEVQRFAQRLLVMNATVANVYRIGNTLKIEGRYSDRSGFYTSARNLRDAVLVAINNRVRMGNADAMINEQDMVWSVEIRNIDLLGTGEQSAQTDGSQYQAQGSSVLRFVGYQAAEPQRIFTSGELRFNWAIGPIYNNEKSYLLYFWYETYGQFYYLATGPMTITDGLFNDRAVLDQIPQTVPGKLKLYRDDSMQGDVAKAVTDILEGRNYAPTFSPVRRGSNFEPLEMTITNLNWADAAFFRESQGRLDRLNFLAGAQTQTATTAERVTDEQMRQVSEMSFTGTVGWEFEGDSDTKTQRELRRFLQDNGTNLGGGYSSDYSTWDLKNDPSVTGRNSFEIASPVETGEEGIEDILLCCRNLQKAGVLVNLTGGVHLHFGYRDWDLQHRKNILKNQITAENLFRATVPTYRRDRHSRWAQLLSRAPDIQNKINQAQDLSQLNRASGSGRYWFINTRTGGKPTWEWRYPTATIEPDSTEMTIRLISKLIEISKFGLLHENDCKPDRLKNWLGEEIGGFWINRMYELSTGSSSNEPTRKPSTIVGR